MSAYHQLNALRADVTRAGGGFGHELSYAISALLQVVGGDLASLYERAGCPEDALAVLETIRARAMADWMGRTHAVWATPRWVRAAVSPISGSVNGLDAAGLGDIHHVSEELGAPLLYYLRQDDGYLAILVTPGGDVASARLADVRSRLADVTRALHLGGSLSRGGVRDLQAARADEVERPPLDAALRALHDALLPPQVRKVLDSSGERVVIVPDPSLNGVPFAALRTPEGTYLIESHELLFLPSATAWLSIAAGARVSTWQRARRAAPVAPLVGGITRFGRSQLHSADGRETARLGDLPGAAAEAKAVSQLLGVKPRLDAGVTTRAVFQASGADVVHLATHGYLDEAHPRASCLVLSDGPLLADELYRSDRGLRAGLVVLSACQTGLGGAHPDSTIGLANAFMIAGAQSVVSTLWRIPDEVTAAMMTAFYTRLVDGDNVAKALRAAQRDVLDEPRTSHPVCWAAFRLAGRPENPLSH